VKTATGGRREEFGPLRQAPQRRVTPDAHPRGPRNQAERRLRPRARRAAMTCGRRLSPSGPGSRAAACGQASTVDRSSSRVISGRVSGWAPDRYVVLRLCPKRLAGHLEGTLCSGRLMRRKGPDVNVKSRARPPSAAHRRRPYGVPTRGPSP
jgi:hypothetical protein